MINTVIFIFFALLDLSMVGLCSYCYSGKEKYSEGMILGVHVPANAEEDERFSEIPAPESGCRIPHPGSLLFQHGDLHSPLDTVVPGILCFLSFLHNVLSSENVRLEAGTSVVSRCSPAQRSGRYPGERYV